MFFASFIGLLSKKMSFARLESTRKRHLHVILFCHLSGDDRTHQVALRIALLVLVVRGVVDTLALGTLKKVKDEFQTAAITGVV
jgi:hypothetical protein